MKIVVTGAESFIGKELIAQATHKGIEVIGIDLATGTDPRVIHADILANDISNSIPADVDAIVHLAALSRDADCRNNAQACFAVNVMGTLNLIRAARNKNARQFIFASSEWVYDRFAENEEKDEESPVYASNLISEYALSKLVSEVNLKQQYQHGFCPVTILRFGIVYGPRTNNWSAVESLFHGVATKPDIVVGSLKTARRFIHVSDIANGIIMSLGVPDFNIINLQGDRLISLGDILEVSKRLLKKYPHIVETNPKAASIRNVSNKKAKQLLGWSPTFGLEEGLASLMLLITDAKLPKS